MYPLRDLVNEHDEQWITREGSMIYFPEAHQECVGPHLVMMETRSIKSKLFGLLSRPALLKFEVYHGSMSERV